MRIHTGSVDLSSTNMTLNITSDVIWLGHIANYAIQLSFSGLPNGTFKLQASTDRPDPNNPKNTVVTNWTDILGSSQKISAAGDHMWSVQDAGYEFVRIVWTNSSSGVSELVSARFMIKGV